MRYPANGTVVRIRQAVEWRRATLDARDYHPEPGWIARQCHLAESLLELHESECNVCETGWLCGNVRLLAVAWDVEYVTRA